MRAGPVVDLTLDVFAVSRLTRMITEDEIFADVRDKIIERFPPEKHKIGYLVTCWACASVWAALLVRSGLLGKPIRDTLALSELVLAVQSLIPD